MTYAARRSVSGLLAATALLAGLLTGCSDDEDGGGEASGAETTATASPSETASESASESASAEPTEAPTTDLGVPPASGKEWTYPNVTFATPAKWDAESSNDFSVSATDLRGDSGGSLFVTNNEQLQPQQYFVDGALEDQKGFGNTVSQGADRDVDGTTWSVVEGQRDNGSPIYELVTVRDGWLTQLQFEFGPQAADDYMQTVDSVLASVQFTAS
jgi:hypothetical protein